MIARQAIRLMVPAARGGLLHDQQIYQPFARVTEAGYSSWVYKGGPRLAATYTGDWDIPRLYPFMTRSQWQFDTAHMAEQRTTLRNLRVVGGVVGGLVSPATLALNPAFGVKTLYGANCIPALDVFGYADYGSDDDRNRQLNSVDPALTESQRGTAYWLTQGNSVHYDDFTTCATLWFYGGGFGSDVERSFQVPSYGALLRAAYANDAAYIAASVSQTRANHPVHDQAWRRHMLRYCMTHALERVRPMHRAAGIESSYNGFAAIPSSWAALCNMAVGAAGFDNLIVELNPADTEPVAGYQSGHDLADTTRLLTWFARVQLACASVRAFGARATLAPYPYIRAVPPNTQGDRFSTFAVVPPTFDDFPPTASTYTEPVTVAANYRATCAWALANGCMPTVPVQVFDYITNFLTGWQGGNRWQWTADPADFAPLFDWIGIHRSQLLDGFDVPPQVALAVPDLDERYSNSVSNSASSATNCWAGSYEVDVGPGWDINRLKRYSRDIITPLMTRHLPWMMALVGEGLDATRTVSQYPLAEPVPAGRHGSGRQDRARRHLHRQRRGNPDRIQRAGPCLAHGHEPGSSAHRHRQRRDRRDPAHARHPSRAPGWTRRRAPGQHQQLHLWHRALVHRRPGQRAAVSAAPARAHGCAGQRQLGAVVRAWPSRWATRAHGP